MDSEVLGFALNLINASYELVSMPGIEDWGSLDEDNVTWKGMLGMTLKWSFSQGE